MSPYSLSHLSDGALLRELSTLVAQDRATTATLLAHLAEVDARKLYLPAAYPSLYEYCVGELRMSEDAACKRIRAARAAHRFPMIFEMVADGRLHLSAVVLLAPYLSAENAADLLAVAAHQTRAQLEELIAARFPRPGLLAWVAGSPPSSPDPDGGDQAGPTGDKLSLESAGSSAPGRMNVASAPARMNALLLRAEVRPLAPECYAVQFSLSRRGHEQLRHAQELLGQRVPSGDLAQVFERALDALIEKLERRKFGATSRPHPRRRGASPNPRHISAAVKRAVWARDGGQCTFVSDAGHRCPARRGLEYDHVEPVARGGQATVAGLRLRCRAHNQYEAERAFGAEFMRHKREQAQCAADARRQQAEARRQEAEVRRREREARAAEAARRKEEARRQAEDARQEAARRREEAQRQVEAARQETARRRAAAEEVITPLRVLGYSAREAREAAALCEAIPEASLEDRLRRALGYFRPRLLARASFAASAGGAS